MLVFVRAGYAPNLLGYCCEAREKNIPRNTTVSFHFQKQWWYPSSEKDKTISEIVGYPSSGVS